MKTKEEIIQDYLDQKLSSEDQAIFDDLIQNDAEFRKELKVQTELHTIIKNRLSEESQHLRQQLKDVEKQFRMEDETTTGTIRQLHPRNESSASRGVFKRYIPYLAAACVLIIAGLFFFPFSNTNTSPYSMPTMRSEIVRGDMSTENQTYEKAVEAFNAGKYKKSSEILAQLIQNEPDIVQYQFYYGLSLVGEQKYAESIPTLEELSSGLSVYKNDAMYYLAISLYETGKMEEAKQYISQIPKYADKYNDAQILLKKIK